MVINNSNNSNSPFYVIVHVLIIYFPLDHSVLSPIHRLLEPLDRLNNKVNSSNKLNSSNKVKDLGHLVTLALPTVSAPVLVNRRLVSLHQMLSVSLPVQMSLGNSNNSLLEPLVNLRLLVHSDNSLLLLLLLTPLVNNLPLQTHSVPVVSVHSVLLLPMHHPQPQPLLLSVIVLVHQLLHLQRLLLLEHSLLLVVSVPVQALSVNSPNNKQVQLDSVNQVLLVLTPSVRLLPLHSNNPLPLAQLNLLPLEPTLNNNNLNLVVSVLSVPQAPPSASLDLPSPLDSHRLKVPLANPLLL